MKKILLLPLLAFAMLSCTAPKTQEPMQNEVINAIMSRRSIRQYHPIPVARDTMMQIMTCGINAANGQNKQSWEVRIIDNPAKMQQILDLMVAGNPTLQPDMVRGCMRGAPVMTFIARDLNYDFSAYDYDEDSHWRICSRCKEVDPEDNEPEAHFGGTATCEDPAECEACQEFYGEALGHLFPETTNKEDCDSELDTNEPQ